jgi:xanthine dehydrogenase accessory factor
MRLSTSYKVLPHCPDLQALRGPPRAGTVIAMEALRKCLEALEAGRDVVLVTVLAAGAGTPGKEGFKLVLTDDGSTHGTVGGGALEHRALADARQALASRRNALATYDLAALGMVCGGEVTLVFEFLPGARNFVLFGGGHVGRALAPILESLGFRVTVYDSRPELRAALEAVPGRQVVIGEYTDIAPVRGELERAEFCFIATHGHQHDYRVLTQVIAAGGQRRYIGLIGSRSKVRTTRERLARDGIPAPDCLYAPVGLALGAQSPAEIAVAVAAEVVALQRGFQAPSMRDR